MTVSRSTLYCASTWLELKLSFRPSNACCFCGTQVHIFFLLSNSLRGFVWSTRWGENLLCWLKDQITFVGGAICRIALTFSGSALTPVPSTIWPRNFTLFWLIWHLSRPNVSPAFLHLAKTLFNRESCSSWDSLNTFQQLHHSLLKCSGAGCPEREAVEAQGVINVVGVLDSGICQYPEYWHQAWKSVLLLQSVQEFDSTLVKCVSLVLHSH